MDEERYFITDFYCAEHKLVIEIDGAVHEKQKDYDELRTLIIEQLGMTVVRVRNEEIRDMKKLLERLGNYL